MPIIHEEQAGISGRWCIWQVTESAETLRAMMPAGLYDLDIPAAFPYEKRRCEWFTARLLLEHLQPGCRITYDEHGKPHAEGAGHYISLTHSADLIVMMHDTQPTGIDIERIHPKIARIAGKFLDDRELDDALRDPQPEKLHAYWCVKEATYKVYGRKGVSLKSNIFVEPFDYAAGGTAFCRLKHEAHSLRCQLQYRRIGEFMLAWTTKLER